VARRLTPSAPLFPCLLAPGVPPAVNRLPKISVVTPNFNCSAFLEQTLLSVLDQGYPNLEYIVVDGGSTDGSLEIIERHRTRLAHVIAEPDRGHADALNKGMRLATGEVMCWINSDDLLLPGSLQRVGEMFSALPQLQWLTGQRLWMHEDGTPRTPAPLGRWSWLRFVCGDFRHIQQESTFWRRSLWQAAGGQLDESLSLANDFELWLRFFRLATLHSVDEPLGCFRTRQGQRSAASYAEYERECAAALQRFVRELPPSALVDLFQLVPVEQWASRESRPGPLPAAVDALDPPLVQRAPDGAWQLAGPVELAPPGEPPPHRAAREDLVFAGLDRAVWHDGPDFTSDELVAASLDIVPFVPNARVEPGLASDSPPMVALVGPLIITDWGSGRLEAELRFEGEAVRHALQLPETGRVHRLTLWLSPSQYVLLLDGLAVGHGEAQGRPRPASPRVVLGGGFAQRFWVGALDRVRLSTRRSSTATAPALTWALDHAEGACSLQRQHRAALPRVPSPPWEASRVASSLAPFRMRHRGQRCFVMGNGPSLNRMDLSLLEGETVFACNAAFLLFERVRWRPTYYACVDTRVVRDRAADIVRMLNEHPQITAFFPAELQLHDGSGRRFDGREVIPPGPNRHYFHEIGNRESHHVETMFSLDADLHVVQPYTVAVTMLQLAVYMGFSEIYLIGCDTSYTVAGSVRQEGRKLDGVGLLLTSTEDDDNNHFDPRYFGRGREWHNPQVGQMLNHYRWARLASRRSGSVIRNATVGGQLEVFERVAFGSLFPARPAPMPGPRPRPPLLSIAIPAYGRAEALAHALSVFGEQIEGEGLIGEVEVCVSDDATPGDGLAGVRARFSARPWLRWRRYGENVGLERNLLQCADECAGEYLWIFGDDDYLETDDALRQVVTALREGRLDMLVLNRTRRSNDLKTVLSPNWMQLDTALEQDFDGLRAFCLRFGFISVLGFISVNIFRRRRFQRVDMSAYMGTMYPQLGAMLEAFHDRPVRLLGRPLVCHRTQTPDEKRAALGHKAGEADFMSDMRRRNAQFFSHPYVAMLDELVRRGAFSPADVAAIRENTVIEGLLVDFLVDCLRLNGELLANSTSADAWRRSRRFFAGLPLEAKTRARADEVFVRYAPPQARLTVSVVSPSFNQAEFLPDCLRTVAEQTHPAIEHLVFDPGSTDGSREIAAGWPGVTLVAEPDEGQSDALNKGFSRVRGDVVCWLNSDDQLASPEVFERVLQRMAEPDAPDIVYGRGVYIDEHGKHLREAYVNRDPSTLPWRLALEAGIMQPALFMRRSVLQRVGPLRKDLHFSMDYEYWIRCIRAGIRFAFVDEVLAVARYHLNNKTYGQRGKSYAEVCRMVQSHYGYVGHSWLRRLAEFEVDGHDGVLARADNAGTRDPAQLERQYAELMASHNGGAEATAALIATDGRPGFDSTLREMQKLGLMPATPLPPTTGLPPPAPRAEHVHVDETGAVARLFQGPLQARAAAESQGPPGVMIDVGAHHGLALAPFLDMGWRIWAFEPDASNRAVLEQRLERHPLGKHVRVDTRAAAAESRSQQAFYRSDVSTGISGLSAFHESHREAQRVDTVTLDEVMRGQGITAVDFLKIDTEGHDLFVLKGFPFDRVRPAVIECEFEDAKTVPLGYRFDDIARFLADLGYTVFVSEWHPIIRYGIAHDWCRIARYPCTLTDARGWGNLLAFAEPPDEAALLAALRPKPLGAAPQLPAAQPSGVRVDHGRSWTAHDPAAGSEAHARRWQVRTHPEAIERLWARMHPDLPPGQYRASVRLVASRAMRVRVVLGRHGHTPWEGLGATLQLAPGKPVETSLLLEVRGQHQALKLQLEPLDLPPDEVVDLEIQRALLAETLDSQRRRLAPWERRLARLHALLDQGNGATALPLALQLSLRHGKAVDGLLGEAIRLASTGEIVGRDELAALLG